MASTQRNTFKYQLKVGNKIIHRGVSVHIDRSDAKHHECGSTCHILKVGKKSVHLEPVSTERRGDRR
jgi:hypothetical protein